MPVPSADQIKQFFEDSLQKNKHLGASFAVKMVIDKYSITAEDIALAFLVPDALDEKSEADMEPFDVEGGIPDADPNRNAGRARAPAPRAPASHDDRFGQLGKDATPKPNDGKLDVSATNRPKSPK